ncbi:MAG: DMT family transporter [Desulfobulbaceae bacterium]|nr:DMT family transporter [Desulfobulbaceae bacterium]MCK5341064.1 DMT family transporter [Desulfobulbaceae bacterium]MCK5404967.1 DMT family transporter [Desulfobulbaceae bacterium]
MGVVLMLLASACFATMAAMIKAIGPSIPMSQLIFLRCLLSLPILFIVLVVGARPLLVRAKGVLVVRSILGMAAMWGYYYSLTHMPLAECVFIGKTQPLLLALLAPFVLGEKTPRIAWLAIMCGLAGVAIIMKPAMAWPAAAWFALGAAAAAAGAQLLVRRLNRTDHPLVIVFNFLLVTCLVSSVRAVPGFVPLATGQWLLIACVAVFATLGQTLMTYAYRLDKAPVIAAASYSSVILSVVYGYFFWGEVPHPLAWIGGALIIFGGMMLVMSRIRREKSGGN